MAFFDNQAVLFETRIGLLCSFSLLALQVALKFLGVFWGILVWVLVLFAFVTWVPNAGERAKTSGDHWVSVYFSLWGNLLFNLTVLLCSNA